MTAKNFVCLLLGTVSIYCSKAQSDFRDFKKSKNWSYINGEQRAVNDSNRVNYWCDPFPSGARVTDFNNMKLLDLNDSQFLQFHLNANQVYDQKKTVSGPSFYISKYEVSNKEYRAFVEDCITTWIKEHQPEISNKFKTNSLEYINAVTTWLGYVESSEIPKSPIKTWNELWLQHLNWNKIKYKGVSIFPNTEAWVNKSQLSFNEPMRDYYFAHQAYNNYPVTCVSVNQAKMYCEWYSGKQSKESSIISFYRLPTEAEWERAASVVAVKPVKNSSGSPIKNNFLRNSRGNYIANFKPSNNNYATDGAIYQTPVNSYFPNDAGCYNMQGNVAEITNSPIKATINEPLDPNLKIAAFIVNGWNELQKQKTINGFIVKGGAWNLPEAACTIGSRTIITEDEGRSYIGFRMVGVPKIIGSYTPEF